MCKTVKVLICKAWPRPTSSSERNREISVMYKHSSRTALPCPALDRPTLPRPAPSCPAQPLYPFAMPLRSLPCPCPASVLPCPAPAPPCKAAKPLSCYHVQGHSHRCPIAQLATYIQRQDPKTARGPSHNPSQPSHRILICKVLRCKCPVPPSHALGKPTCCVSLARGSYSFLN